MSVTMIWICCTGLDKSDKLADWGGTHCPIFIPKPKPLYAATLVRQHRSFPCKRCALTAAFMICLYSFYLTTSSKRLRQQLMVLCFGNLITELSSKLQADRPQATAKAKPALGFKLKSLSSVPEVVLIFGSNDAKRCKVLPLQETVADHMQHMPKVGIRLWHDQHFH